MLVFLILDSIKEGLRLFKSFDFFWESFKSTLVREKVMLRVVLVYAENGVCAEVWDKLGVGKSFRRLWSGKRSKHDYSWIEEMLEDDTCCCCCC